MSNKPPTAVRTPLGSRASSSASVDDTALSSDHGVAKPATVTTCPFGENAKPHEVLGVPEDADEEAIFIAYFAHVRKSLDGSSTLAPSVQKEADRRVADARDVMLDNLPPHVVLGLPEGERDVDAIKRAAAQRRAKVDDMDRYRASRLERIEKARRDMVLSIPLELEPKSQTGHAVVPMADSDNTYVRTTRSTLLDKQETLPMLGIVGGEAFLLCFIALMATVGTRVDGKHTATWAETLTPVWVFDGVIGVISLFVLGCALYSRSTGQIVAGFGQLLGAGLWITSTGLIYRAVDTGDIDALVAFIPMLIVEFVGGVGISFRSLELKGCAVLAGVCSAWVRFLSLLLLGLRIDGHMGDVNYTVTLIPLFLTCLVGWLSMCTSGAGVCGSLLSGTLVYGLVISGSVLVALKAQDPEDGPGPLSQCFIPWYLIACFCVLLLPVGAANA